MEAGVGAEGLESPDVVLVFQRAMGGSVNTFFIAIPFNEWGEIDSWVGPPQILTRVSGEAEAARPMCLDSAQI